MNLYQKKHSLLILALTFLLSYHVLGQNPIGYYENVATYSQTQSSGTARYNALGGSGIALGGEVSAAQINPAGLGFIGRSSWTISPCINYQSSLGIARDTTVNDSKFDAGFSQAGIVFASPSDLSYAWKGFSFAINYSQINNINRNFNYSTYDSASIIDYYLQNLNPIEYVDENGQAVIETTGVPYETIRRNFYNGPYSAEELAVATYLVYGDYIRYDTLEDNSVETLYFYNSFIPVEKRLVSEQITSSGSQGEWNFALGGNIADKLYLGLGLNLQTLNETVERKYSEISLDKSDTLLSLHIKDVTTTVGSGWNWKFGAIYRPFDVVRIGFTYQTPTTYNLTEEYYLDMEVEYNNIGFVGRDIIADSIHTVPINLSYQTGRAPDPTFNSGGGKFITEYTIKTPARLGLGLSFFLGKKGFITVDGEFVNYSKSGLTTNDQYLDLSGDQQFINNNFNDVVNFKIGTEFRLKKDHRLRFGYAYYPTPYQYLKAKDKNIFSFGYGKFTPKWHLDFYAGVQPSNVNNYSPYDLSLSGLQAPVINGNLLNTQVQITYGRFFGEN